MLIAKCSLPPMTITEASTDAEGITLNYDARALAPDLHTYDQIIACALLKTDELLPGNSSEVSMTCLDREIKAFVYYGAIGVFSGVSE